MRYRNFCAVNIRSSADFFAALNTLNTRGRDTPLVMQLKPLLAETLKNKGTPKNPASANAAFQFITTFWPMISAELENEAAFEFVYPRFAAAWPNDAGPAYFLANYKIWSAWEARGGDTADRVTPANFKIFEERLKEAEQACLKGWELDPLDGRCPSEMVRVKLGQRDDRSEMERWFKRAVEANPDNSDLCWYKIYYLFPRWHGSHEEMLKFGHECVATGNWHGQIPFALARVHLAIAEEAEDRAAYFKQPAVWQDVQAVFRPFFDLYPEEHYHRNLYARLACECGQWKVADEQFKIIGESPALEAYRDVGTFLLMRVKAAQLSGTRLPPAIFKMKDGTIVKTKLSPQGNSVEAVYPEQQKHP